MKDYENLQFLMRYSLELYRGIMPLLVSLGDLPVDMSHEHSGIQAFTEHGSVTSTVPSDTPSAWLYQAKMSERFCRSGPTDL